MRHDEVKCKYQTHRNLVTDLTWLHLHSGDQNTSTHHLAKLTLVWLMIFSRLRCNPSFWSHYLDNLGVNLLLIWLPWDVRAWVVCMRLASTKRGENALSGNPTRVLFACCLYLAFSLHLLSLQLRIGWWVIIQQSVIFLSCYFIFVLKLGLELCRCTLHSAAGIQLRTLRTPTVADLHYTQSRVGYSWG